MASNPRQASDVSLDHLSFTDTSTRPEDSICIPRPRGANACFPLLKPNTSLSPRHTHQEDDLSTTPPPLSSANSSPVTESSNFWDTAYSEEGVLSSNSISSFPTSPRFGSGEGSFSSAQAIRDTKPDNSFAFAPFDDWMGWNELGVNQLDPISPVIKNEPLLKTEPRSPGRQSFQAPSSTSFNPEFMDENSVAFQDTLNEEPLFQTPAQTMDSPQPPTRLYSTPLSWERPQQGYSNLNNNNNNNNGRQYSNLTPAEESQLLSIAMPRLAPAYSSNSLSPSPEPHQSNRRKRKSSTSSMSSSEDGDHMDDLTTTASAAAKAAARHPPPKKTAHNMIEKRYRTNLNDKIAALRDSVPSLRVAAQKSEENSNEDLQGLAPAHKLNKATVLSKATEYIAHLEKRNRHLSKENSNLKQRIEAFEILLAQNPNLGGASNMRLNNEGRERPGMPRVSSHDGSMSMQDKRSRY